MAGTKVSDSTSAVASAESTTMAMGRNMRPSTPSSASTGTYTSAMMATPKATGRATSPAASRVLCRTAPGDDGGVVIEVIDSGTGIDPAIVDRVFDPFFTTKPQGEGTGLGLSISYGIVQDHGGSISVASTPGAGARFTVRLPPRPPPREPTSYERIS